MFLVDIDTGFRQGAFDITLADQLSKYIAAEIRFVDEGKQPQGIKNVNLPLNIDGVVQYPIGRFTPFVKAGLTSSYFSHNGSGNGFKNNTGFTGVNYGAGCEL